MTTRKAVPVVAAFAGLLVLGMARRPSAPAVPDTELGLSKASVFVVPEPPPTPVNDSEPGERPTVPASFPQQPPVIPHGVADFLPIGLGDNACLECHAVAEKVEGEATPIPSSHYVDLRRAPEVVAAEVAGTRWQCLACHPASRDSPDLVDNTFIP